MYPIDKYTFKTYKQKNEDGTTSTVVIAISTYAGKNVKATAKCIESDEFSLEKGKRLAAARCDLKVCLKRKSRAMRRMHEAAKIVEMATAESVRMNQYYSDALDDVMHSMERLAIVEKELA